MPRSQMTLAEALDALPAKINKLTPEAASAGPMTGTLNPDDVQAAMVLSRHARERNAAWLRDVARREELGCEPRCRGSACDDDG